MNLTKTTGVFMNLERLPTNTGIELIDRLNSELNEQAGRLETLLASCGTTAEAISFADVMHWKDRARYLRSVGQAKKANELAKKMAALEEEEDHDDTEENYKQFLQDEGLTLS
tara:strand:+ start:231 stop:569 length:339 start_codon:yes stop_codon:yes gene_type:complete